MEYYWSGRIYVDEEKITPEQYKQFFGTYNEYGIKFNIANSILKSQRENKDCDECVPCDELNPKAISLIKEICLLGETSGIIEINGEKLSFNWNPILRIDGEDVDWEHFGDAFEKQHVLDCMLDDDCYWGTW